MKKGFTLIELLVTVALIGILAAVVLSNLSSSRMKAKDAAVASSLSSYRSQAELDYPTGNYTDLCLSTAYTIIDNYVSEQGGEISSCDDGGTFYRIVALLPSGIESEIEASVLGFENVYARDSDSFCVNSNGFSGKIDSNNNRDIDAPYCSFEEEAESFGSYIYCYDHDDCLVYDGSGPYGIASGAPTYGSGGGWSLTSSSLCTAVNSGATYLDCGGATR